MDKVIYRHLKPCGEVFYIGIGNEKRPYKKSNRNEFWNNIVSKHGYEVQILKTKLTIEEASELEVILISYYGRRDLGKGTLVNLTDGGLGTINHTITIEGRLKISSKIRGRKHSEETKQKFKEIAKNRSKEQIQKVTDKIRKPVLQFTLDGIFIKEWISLKEAEDNNYGFIRGCINGTQRKAGGFLWKYKMETNES